MINNDIKGYNDFTSLSDFLKYYNLEHLNSKELNESKKCAKCDAKCNKEEGEENENTKETPNKKVKTDKLEVHYSDLKTNKFQNIFKHIIIFTNDKNPDNNKTLKNIYDAIKNLKKSHCHIIPELHIFIAADIEMDDNEEEIRIFDDDDEFTISKESNIDTLVFSRLGVQGEDQCEHIVNMLQDRGFLVLNPVKYSALACDKYDSACLFEKGEIPQPNFALMTKDVLYDEKTFINAMKKVYPNWDSKDADKNKDLDVVVKILDGHGGTGVALIDGKRLFAWLQLVFAINPEQRLLLQKKEEADGGDIRVHVLTLRNKQVILAAMKRIKIGNDFRSNVSLGASAEPVELTPEQEQIALKTAQLSKLPWCAVDIMPLVKGSNKELGDNAVLEINASPGTAGITDVIKVNFINILLNELTDTSEFMLQDKIAGFIESVNIKFSDNIEKKFLAKLDTGNSTSASTLEVGDFEDDGSKITFKIDGKPLTFDKVKELKAIAGENTYVRPTIIVPEITLGLRKIINVPIALTKNRDNKSTNLLINRDSLSKLGYVVHPSTSHILTPEMEKIKII